MSSKSSELQLDPGISSKPRRASSFWRFAFTLLIIFIGTLVAWVIYMSTQAFSPHRALFFKGALEDADRESYIKPLIDHNQTFDIGVTVWLRATQEEEEQAKQQRRSTDESEGGEEVRVEEEDLQETPLYSDIAFRGVRLTGKDLRTSISFTIPTARFMAENLTANDLRGSFVLIPNSPSSFDNLSSFANYLDPPKKTRLPKINYWPSRAWPFPLGSPELEKELRDRAIDTMSTTLGLVTFHDIPSLCPNESTVDEIDREDAMADLLNQHIEKEKQKEKRRHPYIITRTQLRITDETRPIKKMDFTSRLANLMSYSCGRGAAQSRPSRGNCTRKYASNGHWETQFELDVSSAERKVYELRYAPYLDTLQSGYGPDDLVRVPVIRERCEATNAANIITMESAEDMTVNWTIAFTGRKAYKSFWGDILAGSVSTQPHADNATNYEALQSQHHIELLNGVGGHRWREDYHPRYHIALNLVSIISSWVIAICNFRYWYTRKTTTGISVLPSATAAITYMIAHSVQYFREYKANKSDGIPFWPIIILGFIFALLNPLVELRTALRLEIGTKYCCIPIVRRMAPTHRERASDRVDAKTSKQSKIALLAICLVTFVFFKADELFVRARTEPEYSIDRDTGVKVWAELADRVFLAFFLFQGVCQVALNSRLRTFAGSYRFAAVLWLLKLVSEELVGVPAVVGAYEPLPGTSFHNVLWLVLASCQAVQAVAYPAVSQADEGEHEE